jgi:uncharacterized phage protein gp47/JayE
MPTFPLATLAAQVTATGITAPAYTDILNSLIASFQAIYGSDILLTPDTQDYQMLAIFAAAINDSNQTAIAVYNGFSPVFAQGANLSSLVKINGLQRQIATNSTALVNVVGTAGTVITGGIVQDTNGNLWNLPPIVTIPGGGLISVTVTAQVLGAIAASASTITIIYTPQLGWQSVTNPAAATLGAPIETDAQLRIRQAVSTSLPAQTPLSAIAAAVANIIGVTRSLVYENNTSSTDSNGVPGHTISTIVQGGNSTTIAQTIEAKKSPGTGTFGTTTIVVNDPSGLPVSISFYILVLVPIYVNVTIKALANYVASSGVALQNAIAAFINNLPIGGKVYYNQILSVAQQINLAIGSTYDVTVLQTGTAPSPTGTVDIVIPFNQAASCIVANVVLTTT